MGVVKKRQWIPITFTNGKAFSSNSASHACVCSWFCINCILHIFYNEGTGPLPTVCFPPVQMRQDVLYPNFLLCLLPPGPPSGLLKLTVFHFRSSSTSCGSFACDGRELSRDTECTQVSLTTGFPYWCSLKNHLEVYGHSSVWSTYWACVRPWR